MNSEERVNFLKRITTNPEQYGGRPCIRGMRIRVIDVLDLMAASLDVDSVLKKLPDLENDGLRACFVYTAELLGGRA